jgi:lycopene cyclase domain-containing protein
MNGFFILWDILFTSWGVWGFNDRYLLGIRYYHLPLEEYLFFLLIGFCCLFVYASMNHIIRNEWPERWFKRFFLGLAVIDLLFACWYRDKLYTFWALGLNALVILLLSRWGGSFFLWKKFFIGYVISFIPFMIVNGILTGSFTPEPVVWYDDRENLGLRLGTIPIEDSQYMMLMLLLSIYAYEWYRRDKIIKAFK